MGKVQMHVISAMLMAVLAAGSDLDKSNDSNAVKARLEAMERQLLAVNSTLYERTRHHNRMARADVSFEVVCSRSPFTLHGNEVYKFDTVTLNSGGGYHAATGIFEAPVSGTYLFWASILPYPKKGVSVFLYKEGRIICLTVSHESPASLSYIVRLRRREKVWFQHRGQTTIWGNRHSSYGGTLIHQL
ncbi:multimerin-2-like [Haliotis cracherodii]|uniref:multimerin-2-like n=1 Tax=Haliotis cracherodii TaxID=6455 RepID=UPI0039EBF991